MQTRLDAFMEKRGIRPAPLAREAGISRQHLLRMRKGTADPTLPMMRKVLRAVKEISGPWVTMQDLFDVGDGPAPIR